MARRSTKHMICDRVNDLYNESYILSQKVCHWCTYRTDEIEIFILIWILPKNRLDGNYYIHVTKSSHLFPRTRTLATIEERVPKNFGKLPVLSLPETNLKDFRSTLTTHV